jgi:hypothetical protein
MATIAHAANESHAQRLQEREQRRREEGREGERREERERRRGEEEGRRGTGVGELMVLLDDYRPLVSCATSKS